MHAVLPMKMCVFCPHTDVNIKDLLSAKEGVRTVYAYEPPHDKTNITAYAPSDDSDQHGHPPSLIRVFAVRMKKAWVHSYPLSAQRRL